MQQCRAPGSPVQRDWGCSDFGVCFVLRFGFASERRLLEVDVRDVRLDRRDLLYRGGDDRQRRPGLGLGGDGVNGADDEELLAAILTLAYGRQPRHPRRADHPAYRWRIGQAPREHLLRRAASPPSTCSRSRSTDWRNPSAAPGPGERASGRAAGAMPVRSPRRPALNAPASTGELRERPPPVAAVPADHPLTRRKRVTLADIAAHPVICLPEGTSSRAVFDRGRAARARRERHRHTRAARVRARLPHGIRIASGPDKRPTRARPVVRRITGRARSPFPDVEIPDVPLTDFVLARAAPNPHAQRNEGLRARPAALGGYEPYADDLRVGLIADAGHFLTRSAPSSSPRPP